MQRAREPDTGKITKSKLPKYILTFPIIEVRRGHHQILSFLELLPWSLQNPQLSTSGSSSCTVPIFSWLQKPKSVHSGEFVEPRDFFLRISFRIFFYINMGKVFLRSQLLSKNFIAHSKVLYFLYPSFPLVQYSYMNIVFNTNAPLQLKRFCQDPTTQDVVHKQTQLDFHRQTGSTAHCQNLKSPNSIMDLCVLKQKIRLKILLVSLHYARQ